jgi:hypothetical protein
MDPEEVSMQRHEFLEFNSSSLKQTFKAYERRFLSRSIALIPTVLHWLTTVGLTVIPSKRTINEANHVGKGHLDITAGKHKRITSELLQLTKRAHRKHPLKVFRDHVDQEVEARKYLVHHRAKKNKNLLALSCELPQLRTGASPVRNLCLLLLTKLKVTFKKVTRLRS